MTQSHNGTSISRSRQKKGIMIRFLLFDVRLSLLSCSTFTFVRSFRSVCCCLCVLNIFILCSWTSRFVCASSYRYCHECPCQCFVCSFHTLSFTYYYILFLWLSLYIHFGSDKSIRRTTTEHINFVCILFLFHFRFNFLAKCKLFDQIQSFSVSFKTPY